MPTANKQIGIHVEPTELAQWQEIAKAEGVDLTAFIRQAVRDKVQSLGYTPSTYEYKSGGGGKKAKKAPKK